ncbi:MAG: YafY family transcriptional regulator [Ideonella sp. WA131b]|jgi:predicted DNA-binding transcriptional regulator YafY|nr:YafY family transcriptional regulator [Ideonella sp. WA131b]
MSRSERLLDLLQLLRRHRQAVSGSAIALELGISLRTLYRDIATLQSQGACIDGAPGLGYVMKPGFTLPPLMFSADEVEALVLGSRWVADRGDERLAAAARDAMAKIAAVLPNDLRHELETSALLVGPGAPIAAGDVEVATIRNAIRTEHKLEIRYRDAAANDSLRTIWPFALGYFDRARVVVGWCELRLSIRHFRTDRIMSLTLSGVRYPRRRQAMMKEWREQEGIPER